MLRVKHSSDGKGGIPERREDLFPAPADNRVLVLGHRLTQALDVPDLPAQVYGLGLGVGGDLGTAHHVA